MANVAIFEFVTASGRWFSYRRNNKGPKVDPCGTPDVTELLEMLLQERWFARIDLSGTNRTIVECSSQTRIHEGDELDQGHLLY